MNDRRRFLKRLMVGGVALGLVAGPSTKAQARPLFDEDGELPKGYPWQTTIFCQFADPGLMYAIGRFARRIGCDIYHGEPFSPDIFAIPCFVAIVDRSTLNKDSWAGYLEFREEVEDTTPCILVDNLDDGEGWSIDGNMEIRDSLNRGNVRNIVRRIGRAHRVAQD